MVYTKLRIKFSRTGMLRFISHLDLCRSIRTSFKRAKTPIRYSEGFNPHPRMTFTLPLPLGAQSECEYMDIFVPEGSDYDAICTALDAVSSPELHFITAYVPNSALTDAAMSSYDVILDNISAEQARTVLENPPHISKKNKKGQIKEVDPTPMIRKWEVFEHSGSALVRAVLDCAPDRYLNPDAFAALFGAEDYSIMRTELYFADGSVFR